MRIFWFLLSTAFLPSLFLLQSASVAQAQSSKHTETFTKSLSFAATDTLELRNNNGAIRIESWQKNSISIHAVKKAKNKGDLPAIHIDIKPDTHKLLIETRMPSNLDGGEVQYTIKLPATAALQLLNTNGAIALHNMRGTIDAKTQNGAIKAVDLVHQAKLTTLNGSIRASFLRTSQGKHALHTQNGSIVLHLPSNTGGSFDAQTQLGKVAVEIPAQMEPDSGNARQHKRGTFQGSGAFWALRTQNGSIRIAPR